MKHGMTELNIRGRKTTKEHLQNTEERAVRLRHSLTHTVPSSSLLQNRNMKVTLHISKV